jgi:D-3-phosphoglycerate dehydrogenase
MVILSLDSAIPQHVLDEIRSATEATFIKALHMQIGKCTRSCGCGV